MPGGEISALLANCSTMLHVGNYAVCTGNSELARNMIRREGKTPFPAYHVGLVLQVNPAFNVVNVK